LLPTGLGAYASFLLLAAAFLLTSCSTYATFSSRVKEVDFTFEYPRGWLVTDVEQYPDLVHANILGPAVSRNESSLKVSLTVWPATGTDLNLQAQERLNNDISMDQLVNRNFRLVRNGATNVAGAPGYVAEYTLDHLARDVPVGEERTYIAIHMLLTIIPRNGRVYEISMGASQNEWDRRANDVQHILDTFKWR